MAEGFEPYHVPQQSRRDKLRVNPQGGCVDNHNSHLLSCAPLLVPLYDPSFISPDLISCAANLHHRQSFDLDANTAGAGAGVKDEGMNLMGFAGGVNMISSSSAPTSHMLVDPQLSVQINPSTIQEINGNPFAYTQSNYIRPVLDQSFHGNEVVVYAREPNSNCSASAAAAEAASGQSLSLSLSSNNNSNIPLELNLQRCDSTAMFSGNSKLSGGYFVAGNGGSSSSTQLSRSSVPLGPFTGYASVLKGSRFLKPAHQLLEELCDVGRGIFPEKVDVDSSLLDPPLESLSGNGVDDESSLSCGDGGEQTRKKSRLLSMLDEVYKRYKQYYQQMQAVFASFESVAGLSSAAPFASLAIKAMSKHFKCLKNAIMDQLHFVGKPHGKTNYEREEPQRSENLGRGAYGQRSFHSSGFVDQPVWRPQRGLPERAVTVLRAWLFEHFLHPYPTDTDKLMLAKQTGLSRNQVSNWFINARVRLWKPMVEEIHMLETRQGQKASQRDDNLPTSCAIECENASSTFQRNGDFALKRSRNDLTETAPTRTEEQMNLPFNKLSQNPHLGVRMGNASSSAGVSLTLGLHQNGMGLAESYPITAARRFGLDAHGDAFVVSGFATHDRQIGGHLFHDFQESNH